MLRVQPAGGDAVEAKLLRATDPAIVLTVGKQASHWQQRSVPAASREVGVCELTGVTVLCG